MMTSDKIISVGIVGTSWWADAMYMPALEKHPNAKVTAVCGRDADRAREFASRWGIEQVYTDYDAMLETAQLDAIVISTTNDMHHPMTMKAIAAGLHVLCEKPLALNTAQAEEMADAADSRGIKHLVPFTYSFMPTARYIKELLDAGYIGKPYHLNMRYYTGYGRDGQYMWRFDTGKSGAGVVGDLGSHFMYLAYHFFGKVKTISCELGYHVQRPVGPDGQPYEQGDDSAIITLTFENGAQGVIHVTAMCYEDTHFGQTHHMEFHGSEGTLYSFTDWDTIQRVSGARVGEGWVKELPIPEHIWGKVRRDTVHNTYKDVFREEDFMTRAWISAIVDDTHPKPDFHDGVYIQRMIDACVLSAKEGRRVELDERK